MKIKNYFKSYIPNLFFCLKTYSKKTFLKDLKAGCLVGIVTLPLAIALSIASGVGPVPGMITSIIAGFLVAIIGGSNYQVSGVTGAFTVVISTMVLQFSMPALFAVIFLSGIVLVIMGLFKLGRFAKYIPFPVVTAFSVGIAIIISLSQVKDFLNLTMPAVENNFQRIIEIIKALPTTNINSLLIGVVGIVTIIVVEKINKKLPAMFVCLIVVTLLNLVLKSPTLGDTFGEITILLQPDFKVMDFNNFSSLIAPAVKIALVSTLSTLLTATVADEIRGTVHNPHSELVAQGVGTILSVGFGGLPSAGVIARTNENVKNGAETPVSAIIHAVIMLCWALVFMPIASFIPMAGFSAVLFIVCKNMISMPKIKHIFSTSIFEAFLFLLAFILTAFVDLILAVFICTALAFAYELIFIRLIKGKPTVNIRYEKDHNNNAIAFISGRLNFIDIYTLSKLKTDTINLDDVSFIDTTAFKYVSSLFKKGVIKNITCNNLDMKKKLDRDKEISRHFIL